jgi:hypothetical protein
MTGGEGQAALAASAAGLLSSSNVINSSSRIVFSLGGRGELGLDLATGPDAEEAVGDGGLGRLTGETGLGRAMAALGMLASRCCTDDSIFVGVVGRAGAIVGCIELVSAATTSFGCFDDDESIIAADGECGRLWSFGISCFRLK